MSLLHWARDSLFRVIQVRTVKYAIMGFLGWIVHHSELCVITTWRHCLRETSIIIVLFFTRFSRLDRYGREASVQERERNRARNIGRVGQRTDHQYVRAGGRWPDDGRGQCRGERDRRFGRSIDDGGNTAGRPECGQPRGEEIVRSQLPRAAKAVRLRVTIRHQGQCVCVCIRNIIVIILYYFNR